MPVADPVADTFFQRPRDGVHPADGLEHRRLLVKLPLEKQVPPEARAQHRLEIERIAQAPRV